MNDREIESPNSKLAIVYTVSDLVQAELIKNMLAEHQIKAELGGEHQGGFTGALGVEIIVRESDADMAREFIRIHFPGV